MELNVLDRMILLTVLPKEGDLTTLRILRDLTSALSFSEAELADLKITDTEKGTHWQTDAAKKLEHVGVEIGPRAHALILEAFEALNKEKKMNLEFLPTYEKFEKKG